MASNIYNYFSLFNKEEFLSRWFKNKSIAIVGNGPSETGKSRGGEIDSHDIVVRFNSYKVTGYEKDCGARTDIWVKCSSDDIKHDIRDNNIKLIIYESDFVHWNLFDGYIEAIANEININELKVCCFNFEDHVKIRGELNLFPSTGVLTFDVLRKMGASKVDLYGFSALQDDDVKCFGHYFNDCSFEESLSRGRYHVIDKEINYIRNKLNLHSIGK